MIVSCALQQTHTFIPHGISSYSIGFSSAPTYMYHQHLSSNNVPGMFPSPTLSTGVVLYVYFAYTNMLFTYFFGTVIYVLLLGYVFHQVPLFVSYLILKMILRLYIF